MRIDKTIKRPPLRYHGGKWMLAPWVVQHFPSHRTYVETHAGSAAVLMRKPKSQNEILNDRWGSLVEFYRVLQDESKASRLVQKLRVTPFARSEYTKAYAPSKDEVENARRLLIRSFMGFGSGSANPGHSSGFRAMCLRNGAPASRDWGNYPDHITSFTDRLRDVVLENWPAERILQKLSGTDTLVYCDPPYLHGTRTRRRASKRVDNYAHEMTDLEHESLVSQLIGLDCMVVLSAYRSEMYDDKLSDWQLIETDALADGARPRREALYINPACWSKLQAERHDLFSQKQPACR